MLTLITKDIRAIFTRGKKGDGHGLKAIITLACALLFALLEYGLMLALFSRAQTVISAPVTLATMILTVISVIMTVIAFSRASKLFFDKQDTQQVSIRPISSGIVTTSRLLALSVMHIATAMIFEYPVFLAYRAIYSKTLWFSYMAFAYPLFAGICEIGIALALLYPLRLLWQYVKRNPWVRAGVIVALTALVLCPCAIFIHKLTAMFTNHGFVNTMTDDTVSKMINFKRFVIPINLLIDYIFKRTNGLFPYLAISGGIFMLSSNFAAFFLNKIGKISNAKPSQKAAKPYEQTPLTKHLLLRELILRVANPNCPLTVPILLLIQPYVLYLAARIFTVWLKPNLIVSEQSLLSGTAPLVITLCVVAMTLIIYSLSDTRKLLSSTAIKPFDLIHPSNSSMIVVKVLAPAALSATFLLISILVLLIFGMLTPLNTVFTFLISVMALATVAMVSWHQDPNPILARPKFYYNPTVAACAFIIMLILLGAILSLVHCHVWAIYLIETLACLALGTLPTIKTIKYAKTVVRSKKNDHSSLT